jgi:hypothetical protein
MSTAMDVQIDEKIKKVIAEPKKYKIKGLSNIEYSAKNDKKQVIGKNPVAT